MVITCHPSGRKGYAQIHGPLYRDVWVRKNYNTDGGVALSGYGDFSNANVNSSYTLL